MKRRIILGVSGSIAAYKAPTIARALLHYDFEVRIAMTHGGKQFVSPASFAGVSGHSVYLDMWEEQKQEGSEVHTEWGNWADAVVIAPASASLLSDLSRGAYNSSVSLVAANLDPKLWHIAPAMSDTMWNQPAVQENVSKLTSWGVNFLFPTSGRVADGSTGMRLMEPKAISKALHTSIVSRYA